jgi:hypothetical protein
MFTVSDIKIVFCWKSKWMLDILLEIQMDVEYFVGNPNGY